MPGVVPRRRTRDEDDESESDVSSSGDYDGSKRQRLDGTQNPVLPNNYLSTNGHNGDAPLQHHPGSIVRVTMRNFVTYSAAEFLPGPSLNMVIGPNGTGKSTLVCAICLGLGSKPEVLGRAKDPSEFVKHGAREAEIEIELARDPTRHRSNPVIKRTIKRDSNNKTYFTIDGRNSTSKAVIELCRSFSIQVDNLCQFLPQDRVVEFAALKPVDLLVHTQRAAAPDYMNNWHEQLKQMRNDQVKAQGDQEAMTESLKNLEGRQNLQRGDVERLRERAKIVERLAALERLRPFPHYRVARLAHREAKEKHHQSRQEQAELQQQCEPALAAVHDKQAYVSAVDKVVKQHERLVDRANNNIDMSLKKQKTLSESIAERTLEIDAEKQGIKKQKQDRVRIDRQIKDLERQAENEPPQIDMAAHNEKSRDTLRKQHEKENAAREANTKQAECVNQGRSLEQRRQKARQDIEQLRSKAGQQTNKLKSVSPDSARGWEWIQANKDQFTGPVFGPAIIECSVKDPKFANAVESLLGTADFTCFTVTNNPDFDMLQRELINNMRLSDINLRILDAPLSSWKKPIPNEELPRLGLNCYLLDVLEGPDEVLSMLCDNRSIHASAIAFQDMRNDQYDAITRTQISVWATPSETYRITRRREYGDQGTSTRTDRIKNARFFTSQPVDTHAEEELKNLIAELTEEWKEAQKQAEAYRAENARNGHEHRQLQEEKKRLDEEKKRVQDARSEWQKLPIKIEGLRNKLRGLDESAHNYRTRVQTIKDLQDKQILDRAQDALKLASSVSSLQKLETDMIQAKLVLFEGLSDLETLTARNQQVRQMLAEKEQEVQHLDREMRRLKQVAQAAMKECNHILEAMSENEQEIYNELGDQTPEEFEVEIDSTKARLEMVHEGNPRILREYQERGQQIERARGNLERIERQLGELEANIIKVRQKWEPELDQLVSQISDAFGENFAKINCAGQVVVDKDEDFSQWAIQIQVKFREQEELSVLDAHRQSGGERAVSTIFYLMALQSLARAPFRVVDEINQGMDPRNERMVHSRMVDIACSQHTSQYFLITPKLLPNLMYHHNMKVHCIASGEYMPEDQGKLDFTTLAQKALQVYGTAG